MLLYQQASKSQEARTDEESTFVYPRLIDQICKLNWHLLTREELMSIAWVYYYFSVQFRESLEIACSLFPNDDRLRELDHGERNTDNLSPWPGIAHLGERMNHDEFMRRTLGLTLINDHRRTELEAIGSSYLAQVAKIDRVIRATSIASYEDGGLETVFRSILKANDWNAALLQAFKHFLTEHIKFDSDPEHGHGAICRHLAPDDAIVPLWAAFHTMLVAAAPALAQEGAYGEGQLAPSLPGATIAVGWPGGRALSAVP
jgi:hypothetical protein